MCTTHITPNLPAIHSLALYTVGVHRKSDHEDWGKELRRMLQYKRKPLGFSDTEGKRRQFSKKRFIFSKEDNFQHNKKLI